MTEPPVRKENRLMGYDYTKPGTYFVTICTRNKTNLFWVGTDVADGAPLLNVAGRMAAHFVERIPIAYPCYQLHKYVVMPNHLHLLFTISQGNTTAVGTAIGQTKARISRAVGFPCWQKEYHDHIVRNEADYLRIWQYIDNNPVKWALDCFYCE